jgi:hypothetical protein
MLLLLLFDERYISSQRATYIPMKPTHSASILSPSTNCSRSRIKPGMMQKLARPAAFALPKYLGQMSMRQAVQMATASVSASKVDELALTGIARCSLTCGSIQRPGISKFCGICGKQYLDERKISDLEPQPLRDSAWTAETHGDQAEDARQLPSNHITLAQIILSAADRCIYCGGKFIG